MADSGADEISLRGPTGRWEGLVDSTSMGPGFSRLENCYVSRDGSELRRWLGDKVVGQPFLGEPIELTSITAGSIDEIELDRPHFEPGVFLVYLRDCAVIPDGIYPATRTGEKTFNVPGMASASNTNTGVAFVQRVYLPHVLTHADGRAVVIAETATNDAETGLTTSKFNIASWVSSKRLDPDFVEIPGYLDQQISETSRAVNDGFMYWPSPTVTIEANDFDDPALFNGSGAAADPHIFSMAITRRMVADVLNRRVLIAVPGHGCMFEVNLERDRLPLRASSPLYPTYAAGQPNPVYEHRYTRALGVPRASIDEVNLVDAGAGWAGELVYVAAAYYDPLTDEVGLLSRIASTNVPSGKTVQVIVEGPRGVLRECAGLYTILYLSEPGGTQEGVYPHAQYQESHETINRAYGSSLTEPVRKTAQISMKANLRSEFPVAPRRRPLIEQMPTGASWVRVVRSRMFAGGDTPDAVEVLVARHVESQVGGGFLYYVTFLSGMEPTAPAEEQISARADGYMMPPAYEGHRIVHDVDESEGTAEFFIGNLGAMQWRLAPYYRGNRFIVNAAVNEGGLPGEATDAKRTFLLTQPDLVRVSEENRPGVCPATNLLPVDTLGGHKTTGMARLGDEGLVFTDQSTHLFVWGSLPRFATSRTVSTQYGCVAPASVVEGPGFAAWMSAEGPVVYHQGQGLQWIGHKILGFWRTLVTQSDGLMCEIQGLHDRDRSLVIWQVAQFYGNSSSDAAKSKSPTTHLLVWNYVTDSWSVITRPRGARTTSISVLPINESLANRHYWAPCALLTVNESAWWPIHMFDERWNDRVEAPRLLTATQARQPGTAQFFGAGDPMGDGDEGFIRHSRTGEIRWFGTYDAASARLNDADGAHWEAGDILESRIIIMKMSTNFVRAGEEIGVSNTISGVALRMESFQNPTATYRPRMYARARVENQDGEIVTFTKGRFGDSIEDGVTRFRHGSIKAEHFKVHVEIVANVQVRLKDLTVEVEASG